MAGMGDEKGGGKDAGNGAASAPRAGKDRKSLAARRRRVEMMRERKELMAMLDDFGDGVLDEELVLELADDDDDTRWVAMEEAEDEDDDDVGPDDEDDDHVDDEYPEDD